MAYIDGFVIPIAVSAKERFIEHATYSDAMFLEMGAIRVVECWADDVPHGKLTDFYRSVQAGEDETVAFSWIEWPDKETRDAAYAKLSAEDNDDPRVDIALNPPPFDSKRMIFGGFIPVVDMGDET